MHVSIVILPRLLILILQNNQNAGVFFNQVIRFT